MKELDAVNDLLREIGSSPVNSLSSPHPDVASARRALARVRERVQKRGYWFNMDYDIVLSPDPSTSEIRIPDELTTLVMENRHYIKRGKKLYDKFNQTYKFTADVNVARAIRILEWDDMADVCQEYCAYVAAAEYVRVELEDETKVKSLQISAGETKLYLDKEDLEQGQYNMFQSYRYRRGRAGVSPYRLNLRGTI